LYGGTDAAYRLATKQGTKVAWGTDILFALDCCERRDAPHVA
jgi:imidazolonepropionase-like amidohydrolase